MSVVLLFVFDESCLSHLRVLQQDLQSFPTEGFSKTNTPYLCLFLRVCSGYGSLVCVSLSRVAVRAGLCAAATEYNQDSERDVLS